MKRNLFKLKFGLVALFLCLIATNQAFAAQKIAINNHIFNVEIAQTLPQLQQGLMFRTQLAPNEGMLFVHSYPRILSMWMKNTKINLDMLFMNDGGKIIYIHTAKAEDLTRINSPAPAKYVLEINAGIAKQLDININDKVNFNP